MLDRSLYETPLPAPRAVFDRLAARATRVRFHTPTPDGSRATTFAEYATQIRRIARFLAIAGLAPGDRAAIFGANRVEWMSAALGVQSAGAVMVPIYPASLAPQAAYVIAHSDAKVVFVDGAPLLRRLLSVWSELGAVTRVVVMDDDVDLPAVLGAFAAEHPLEVAMDDLTERVLLWSVAQRLGAADDEGDPERFDRGLREVSLEQTGVMLYTSGTTGLPKGVPLTHANLAHNGIDWFACNAPLLREGMVDVLWLPMSHVFGFGEACIGNTLGWTTHLATPAEVLGTLPVDRPDVFMSVPAYWEKLAQQAMAEATPDAQALRLRALTGGRLSFCLSGGAGLKREVKELFARIGVILIEGYGLSECSPTLTLNRPNDYRFDSVGKPLPSVEIRLDDDGEILARGPNIFAGYHKDPEATRAAFTDDGWFKTGDIGRFTEDGFLQIVDRKKEILVTSGGKNIPPVNVEMRFADEPLIERLVVYGDGKKCLVAGVWLAPGQPVDDDTRRAVGAVIDRHNETLASYERIKAFGLMAEPLSVEGGHLTSTLKLRRKQVYEAFRPQFEALYDEPAT